ncbi:esterase, partial [Mycobacterium sp. ITM-2017-0098]
LAALPFSAAFGAMYFPGVKSFVQGDTPLLDGEIPAANGVATARALARMYGAIANGGRIDGMQYLSSETTAALAGRRSLRLDHSM